MDSDTLAISGVANATGGTVSLVSGNPNAASSGTPIPLFGDGRLVKG